MAGTDFKQDPREAEQVSNYNVQRNKAIREDADCYQKARLRGEQTFTLVERDITSPRTIAFWIMENINDASPNKLRDALEDALAMRYSPIPKKFAD